MPYVLANALANPPHAERIGTATGLNYFEMQYKDLILSLCIISIRVCGWPAGFCNGESNSFCPTPLCTIRCCYGGTASAQLEEQVFHRWTAGGLLTALPNNRVLGNNSPSSLLKGSANFSCPPTINHIFSMPPSLRYSNAAG